MSSDRFASIEYNIANSSWHLGPNGPQCHEQFVKCIIFTVSLPGVYTTEPCCIEVEHTDDLSEYSSF